MMSHKSYDICPKCSHTRKKASQRSLSVYKTTEGTSVRCFHCGYQHKERTPSGEILPEPEYEFKPFPDNTFMDDYPDVIKYEYRNTKGDLLFYIIRTPDKRFFPAAYTSTGEVVMKRPPWKSLYRSELLHDDGRMVIVVEGEKTADATAKIFSKADVVSWVGGAQNVSQGDWDLLAGRVIYLWPDNDDAGVNAMKDIASRISSDRVFLLDVSTLPAKHDLADPITKEQLTEVWGTATNISDPLLDGELDPTTLRQLHAIDYRYYSFGYPFMDTFVKLPQSGFVVISGRTNHGKGQPYGTPILTKQGFVRLEDLSIGTEMASVDGDPSVISDIFPHKQKPTYKVTFSDNTSTTVWDDHLWEVSNSHGNVKVVDTLTLKKDIELGYRRYIPLFKGDYGVDTLPIHPYLLGTLLGDGGLTADIRISSADQFIITKLSAILGDQYSLIKYNKYDYYIKYLPEARSNPLLAVIRWLGLNTKSIDKHLPDEVLTSSRAYRIQVLQGLMDTDGTVSKKNQVSFGSSSSKLFNGFVELARSVGLIVKVNTPKTTTHKDHFRATITGDVEEIITLPRKLDRLKYRKRLGKKAVKSIEFVGNFDGACIKVTHKRELYVTENYIVTHNTQFMINTALNVSKNEPDVSVLFLSYELTLQEMNLRMVKCLDDVERGVTGWKADQFYDRAIREGSIPAVQAYEQLLFSKRLRVVDAATSLPIILSLMKKYGEAGKRLIIIIDYIQIMRTLSDRTKARYEQLKDTVETIREIANRYNQLLITGSQLTAGESAYTDQVRESKDIENTATLHLKVWNKAKARNDTERKVYAEYPGEIMISVEKSRQSGANGRVFGFFSPNGVRYVPAYNNEGDF